MMCIIHRTILANDEMEREREREREQNKGLELYWRVGTKDIERERNECVIDRGNS